MVSLSVITKLAAGALFAHHFPQQLIEERIGKSRRQAQLHFQKAVVKLRISTEKMAAQDFSLGASKAGHAAVHAASFSAQTSVVYAQALGKRTSGEYPRRERARAMSA